MYLLKDTKCKECYSCIEFCPESKDPKIMNCKHCPDAPCKEACDYNAFYEVAPGVYGIDPDICVGCGKCAEACPYDAIVMEDGIAKKCTLCGECVSHCPLHALKIAETDDEIKEKEGLLGWKRVKGEDIGVYHPSIQEARFLDKFIKLHREFIKDKNEDIDTLMDEYIQATDTDLNETQIKKLTELAKMETSEFSIITPLLKRDDIEEISVITDEPIRIFKRGIGWVDTNVSITNEEKLIEIANKMASNLDRRLTLHEPRMNAALPDGSRIHAVIPPVSQRATLTIRKFRKRPFSPMDLSESNTLTLDALAYLWVTMQWGVNVVISGSTGSGKTTTLNSLLAFIPKNQRVIIIEETPEVFTLHPHHVRLIVNSERGIGMGELVEDSLRMRPDRVVVGEVRNIPEIKAWINTTLAGQGKGSIATFHALSGRETINRLLSMGIPKTDLSALNLIIVQRRWTNYTNNVEIRRVTEIIETELKENKIELRQIYMYNPNKDRLMRTKVKSELMSMISKFSGTNITKEVKQRKKFLDKSSHDLHTAFEQINDYVMRNGNLK